MNYNLFTLLTIISPILLLIGIIIGAYYRKHLNRCFLLLFGFLILGFITEILSRYLGLYSNLRYNLFLIPIYGLTELLLFSVLYYKYLLKSKNRLLQYFIVILIILILVDISRIGNMFIAKKFQSYGKVIADGGIVMLCLFYYWEVIKGKIKSTTEINILNAANIIFFSLSLLIFLSINFLVNANYDLVMIFWFFNLIIISLYYTTLILLIWQNGKTRKSLH